MVSRLKVMSNMNIVERRHSQDGRITIQHSNRPRDLRVATFPTILGEKIVVRIHDVLIETHSFAQLGMSPRQVEQLDKFGVCCPIGSLNTHLVRLRENDSGILRPPMSTMVTSPGPPTVHAYTELFVGADGGPLRRYPVNPPPSCEVLAPHRVTRPRTCRVHSGVM